jgi:hypothetical protein
LSYRDTECDACGQPWDIHVIMGCVHEHSGHVRFCVKHRARLNEELYCTPCVNDHPCPIRIVTVLTDLAA